jgi:hypothetical protein
MRLRVSFLTLAVVAAAVAAATARLRFDERTVGVSVSDGA